MTRALVLNILSQKTINLMVVSFAFLVLFAVAMPQPARAAALSENQVQDLLNLLASFDADQEVVENVEDVLRSHVASEEDVTVAPTCNLVANKESVFRGESVTLTWTSDNAEYASQRGGGFGPVEGSIVVEPKEGTTYVKTVYNSIGSATCSVYVDVVDTSSNSGSAEADSRHQEVAQSAGANVMGQLLAAVIAAPANLMAQLSNTDEKLERNEKLFRELKQRNRERDMASSTMYVKPKMASTTSDHKGQKPVPPGIEKNGFPGASACGFLVRNLKRGMSGSDVTQFQEYLRTTGDLKENASGVFDSRTEDALKKIQARYNIVSSGDATSTGFGAVGPRTRNILMAHCKALIEKKKESSQEGSTSSNGSAPTCTLTASKSEVTSGETVTLTWASTNATYASMPGGDKGPANGSIEVVATESTTYLKRVYGPGGQGSCTAEVSVTGDTSAPERKVVQAQVPEVLDQVFSSAGQTLAAAITAYFDFFGVKF